jgi:hypothetical protein
MPTLLRRQRAANERRNSWHDIFTGLFSTPSVVLRRDKKNIFEVIWVAVSIIIGVILHSEAHRPRAANFLFANSSAIRSRSASKSIGDPTTNVTWQTSFFALVSLLEQPGAAFWPNLWDRVAAPDVHAC